MDIKKINFGVVGTGRMASNMLDAMRYQPQINVHAAFGHSIDRVKSFSNKHNIANAYDDLDALLSNTEIDAIYIASSNENHAPQTLKALRAGKSVLCEKPIAISTEELALIQQAATASNCLCMEAMWTHLLPSYERLFEASQEQTFGTPVHLYADFGYPADETSNATLFSAKAGGGVLLDRAVYPIALAIKLFGPVEGVHADLTYNKAGADTDARLLLSHQGGGRSQLAVSARTLLQNRAVLSFTKGSVSLEPPLLGSEVIISQQFDINIQAPETSKSVKTRIKNKLKNSAVLRKINSLKTSGQKAYIAYGANQYLPMLNHFCGLMNHNQMQSNVVPLAFSSEVIAVIDQIKQIEGKR